MTDPVAIEPTPTPASELRHRRLDRRRLDGPAGRRLRAGARPPVRRSRCEQRVDLPPGSVDRSPPRRRRQRARRAGPGRLRGPGLAAHRPRRHRHRSGGRGRPRAPRRVLPPPGRRRGGGRVRRDALGAGADPRPRLHRLPRARGPQHDPRPRVGGHPATRTHHPGQHAGLVEAGVRAGRPGRGRPQPPDHRAGDPAQRGPRHVLHRPARGRRGHRRRGWAQPARAPG